MKYEIPGTGITIDEGEILAIVGPGGCGKSSLALRLASHYPTDVKYVAFQDSYGFASDRSYYLQQRWNSTEIDEDSPDARAVLDMLCGGDPDISAAVGDLVVRFGLEKILDKNPVTFSSGELRKFQLVKSLARRPKVLVIDNPFIGLDSSARLLLSKLLMELGNSIILIIILSRYEEIPDYVTSAVCGFPNPVKIPLKDYLDSICNEEIISFHNVHVAYGDRTIIDCLDWTVRRGEHWALTGNNGSGKSTLLSLVCADNPMAYACDIRLFGKRRGTGESIWEIKKKIGYVSPEMHRSYKRNQPAVEVVASGLFDTVGLFHSVSDEQRSHCLRWMQIFGIDSLAEREFMKLSSTEQRLCLVCRAFVKEPPLLILDEPLHGMDNEGRFKVREIIDSYCSDPSRTLIMVSHYPEEYPRCIDHSLNLPR